MIKSKLNKFTLGLVFILTLIFTTLDFLLILQKYTELQILSITIDFEESIFVHTTMAISGILIFLNILVKLKSVTIDKKSRTISIKNYLTGFRRQYLFKELNGFINSNWGPAENGNRSIFLIMNNEKIEKISEFTIRNFDEILKGLEGIKNLGCDDSSFIDRIRNTFRFK